MPRGVMRDKETGKFTELKQCTNKQIDVIYSLVYEDLTAKQICEKHNVPMSTYYNWFGQELFANRLKEERDKKFKELSGKALKKLGRLMDCGDKRTELKAAQLVLLENGHLDRDLDSAEKPQEIHITLEQNNE